MISETLGVAYAYGGDAETGLAHYQEAIRIARENALGEWLDDRAQQPRGRLSMLGRVDEALAALEAGYEEIRSLGLALSDGLIMQTTMAECELRLGHWDAASARMERLLEGVHEEDLRLGLTGFLAALRARQGCFEAAADLERQSAALLTANVGPQSIVFATAARAEVALLRGEPEAARAIVRATHAEICGGGIVVLPDDAARRRGGGGRPRRGCPGRGRPDEVERARAGARELDAALRSYAFEAPTAEPAPPETAAVHAQAEAELARLDGAPGAQLWAQAAERWERLGFPYPAAAARLREAEARLEAGERALAAAPLRTAHATLCELGAAPLRERAEALAKRARDRAAGALRGAGAAVRPHRARADRARAPGRRRDEPADRRRPLPEHAHGRHARAQPPLQARRGQPRRGGQPRAPPGDRRRYGSPAVARGPRRRSVGVCPPALPTLACSSPSWPVPACGGDDRPSPSPQPGPRLTAAVERELDFRLREGVADAGIPGASAAVVFPDGRIWRGAAGDAVVKPRKPMTPDTAFPLDSITKTTVAALAMRLVEEGRLRLDDPVVRWYPRWRGDDRATIRDLLGHTSGARDPQGEFDPDEPLTQARALAAAPKPGPRTDDAFYSNVGYVIAGHALERAAREPLAAALRRRVFGHPGGDGLAFQPAERPRPPHAHSYWYPDGGATPVDASDGGPLLPNRSSPATFAAAGALAGDIPSVARWTHELFEGRIVSAASLREMTRFRPRLLGGLRPRRGEGLVRRPRDVGPRRRGARQPQRALAPAARAHHAAVTWNDDLLEREGGLHTILLRAALGPA